MGSPEFTRAVRTVWEAMAQGWDQRHAYLEGSGLGPWPSGALSGGGSRSRAKTDLEPLGGGTGWSAWRPPARSPRRRVILGDFSPAMVEVARGQAAALGLENVEFRVLDAEALDLPADLVDVVLCRVEYMLMGDPGAALAESRRRRLAGADASPAPSSTGRCRTPGRRCRRRCSTSAGTCPRPRAAPRASSPSPTATCSRGLFTRARFTNLRIEEVPFTWTFVTEDDYWAFLNDAAGALCDGPRTSRRRGARGRPGSGGRRARSFPHGRGDHPARAIARRLGVLGGRRAPGRISAWRAFDFGTGAGASAARAAGPRRPARDAVTATSTPRPSMPGMTAPSRARREDAGDQGAARHLHDQALRRGGRPAASSRRPTLSLRGARRARPPQRGGGGAT